MKIAQIVPSLESRHGGPSRSVHGLAGGLAGLGHDVELLSTGAPAPADDPAIDHLTVRIFPRTPPATLACSAGLDRHLHAGRYEIVHHHALWLRTLHYAHRAARSARVPLVLSPRGMMSPWAWQYHRWKKAIAATWFHPGAFAAVAGWHATSAAEADDIRRRGFTQPLCISPNGVHPPVAAAESAAAAYWRQEYPALAGRRVALFYSRFHSKKRVLELIALWATAPRGDWILLLVGIPEEYSVDTLRAAALAAGPHHSIVIADGTDAPMPYAVANLLVLPTHSENFGLVVAEALVRGVPVLTTDTTPWEKLSVHDAGACVPWPDFGRTLDSLLAESPERLQDRGQAGAHWAQAEFSWTGAARRLADFYSTISTTR